MTTTLSPRQRLSLGTPELDALFGGGLIKGSANLVSGAPGVGKTTLGLQYLAAGIKSGETGLLVSFEEFPASLIRDAKQLGWDLHGMEKAGQLGIVFTSPQVFLESLKMGDVGPIAAKIQQLSPSRVVIDSASHFQRLTNDQLELREVYNTLVNAMKRQDMTSLLLDEALKVLETQQGRMASLPFLVDTVVLLRYVEVDSSIQRAIAVMKMRGSSHQKEIRRFHIREGGLELGKPFSGREGILSGSTYRIS
jgi:circadian clock protein KaiC